MLLYKFLLFCSNGFGEEDLKKLVNNISITLNYHLEEQRDLSIYRTDGRTDRHLTKSDQKNSFELSAQVS